MFLFSDIDDCATPHCLHGSCYDKVNDYGCSCDPGWEGKDCDEGQYRGPLLLRQQLLSKIML